MGSFCTNFGSKRGTSKLIGCSAAFRFEVPERTRGQWGRNFKSAALLSFKRSHGQSEDTIMIDLRSDTVTFPTEEMREAMARAELGDDSRDRDPTVRRLEEMAAAMTGKEAALVVGRGTLSNLAA